MAIAITYIIIMVVTMLVVWILAAAYLGAKTATREHLEAQVEDDLPPQWWKHLRDEDRKWFRQQMDVAEDK